MFRAISRYGARYISGSFTTSISLLLKGKGIGGEHIDQFEEAFAKYHQTECAISTSYGRMAFYYILKAMNLPQGSEIIFPSLTYWVIPEVARSLGFKPIFVDTDPRTFNMNPEKLESLINASTRIIVPTHLYGQVCDMKPIMKIANKHNLLVIEDCAHALGATYDGQKAGTFGQAAFFSFQLMKPLSTFGGGMAITNDKNLGNRIQDEARRAAWPSTIKTMSKMILGFFQQAIIKPFLFTPTLYPVILFASFFKIDPCVHFWQKIQTFTPLPADYHKRFTNAQALLGLHMLGQVDKLNEVNCSHANKYIKGLQDLSGIELPYTLPNVRPVYYQFCVRVANASKFRASLIKCGIDIEFMHADICNKIDLFGANQSACPVAESIVETVQLPVYASLAETDIDRIISKIQQSMTLIKSKESNARKYGES